MDNEVGLSTDQMVWIFLRTVQLASWHFKLSHFQKLLLPDFQFHHIFSLLLIMIILETKAANFYFDFSLIYIEQKQPQLDMTEVRSKEIWIHKQTRATGAFFITGSYTTVT